MTRLWEGARKPTRLLRRRKMPSLRVFRAGRTLAARRSRVRVNLPIAPAALVRKRARTSVEAVVMVIDTAVVITQLAQTAGESATTTKSPHVLVSSLDEAWSRQKYHWHTATHLLLIFGCEERCHRCPCTSPRCIPDLTAAPWTMRHR